MAFPIKSNPLLLHAIDNADKSTLQAVLKSMCESSVECSEQASQRLLVTRSHEIVNLDNEGENDTQDSGPARKKQKRETHVAESTSRYETCATCLKRFDVTDNREDSCQLHDGALESLILVFMAILTRSRRSRSSGRLFPT